MTSYLDEHPGGDDVILAATGILVLSYGLFPPKNLNTDRLIFFPSKAEMPQMTLKMPVIAKTQEN